MSIFENKPLADTIESFLNNDDIINKELVPDDKARRNIQIKISKKVKEEIKKGVTNSQLDEMAELIKKLFTRSYIFVAFIFVAVFITEIWMIKVGLLESKDRSVNSTALIALVTATFTQIGVGFILVTRYFFKKEK